MVTRRNALQNDTIANRGNIREIKIVSIYILVKA